MGRDILFLLGKGEVVIESLFLLRLHNRFQLQPAQLPDDEFRGERITLGTGESSTQLLRGQIFHRPPHIVLLRSRALCEGLHGHHKHQGQ